MRYLIIFIISIVAFIVVLSCSVSVFHYISMASYARNPMEEVSLLIKACKYLFPIIITTGLLFTFISSFFAFTKLMDAISAFINKKRSGKKEKINTDQSI